MTRYCLFVGAFTPTREGRGGGQLSQCQSISSLSLADDVVWLPIDVTDSTAVKTPVVLRTIRAILRLCRIVRATLRYRPRYALIFTSCYALSLFEKALFGCALRLCRVFVVYSYRSRLELPVTRSVRLGLSLCDHAAAAHLVQSSAAAVCLHSLGIARQKCIVMRNVVDAKDHYLAGGNGPAHARSVGSTLSLIFVGWAEPIKGLKYLFKALAQLRDEGLSVHLRICALGTEEPFLRKLASDLGITAQVEWMGWLNKEELTTVLARSDALVLPSLSEGLPNAVLEAYVMGIPVVATAVGGIPELVEHGVTGFLCPSADSNALAACIRRLADAGPRRKEMGLAGRAKVIADYGPDQARAALRRAFQIS